MKKTNVGILGLGFMGKCHYETYQKIKNAKVAAICDIDSCKLLGDWSAISGNIGGKGGKVNLAGISLYRNATDMFADSDIDVIDITLPTYLHEKYALAAIAAGKDVICEKPLARCTREAKRVVAAAKKHGRLLFTAHCLRFWPAYAWLSEAVAAKKFGRLVSAVFRRHSPLPTWSWKNWLQDYDKSGLCALDLHIHDADFILSCFGTPKSVRSAGVGLKPQRLDHIHTVYEYGDALVSAEGAWEYAPSYPFSMSFTVVFANATVALLPDGSFAVHYPDGSCQNIKLLAGDGYYHELCEFIQCVRQGKNSKRITPEDACCSVRLIELEERSAITGKRIIIKGL